MDVFVDSAEFVTLTVNVINFCDAAAELLGSIWCVNFVFLGFLTRSCKYILNVLH